jgi:tetratricopeptide (TPR) repeat protein/DNA-binding MarR family transcriptional regulator
MAQLYNPDLLSEQELRETFVARQDVLTEILSLIQRQPDGAGVQHVVIIAPRGMGKTTLLLMVELGIRDEGLDAKWQYVRFAEESYGVYDLADFWMHALEHLSADASDPTLQTKANDLKEHYKNANDLAEAALALLKDWCKEHSRRLVLLVDNVDLILSQIDNEQENARLRQVLMNDGCMMLIGGATTFFHEARAYDQPLYNFFKIIHLRSLSHEEILDLLKQRAAMDGKTDFEGTLEANRTRVRVLEYFTGGNPRLVLMLYRVLAKSEVLEVRRGMEELLDQVTPFYKDKMESLPAQQRKILDHIARVSAQTHEGTTPTDIAGATRMTPNAVSSQLKRLADLGYVRAANTKGRKVYYTLSEPLYAIWHQMRFGRDARRKMQWLINFLQGWYKADEIIAESERLGTRFEQLLAEGLMDQARSTLEHRRYLFEAIGTESTLLAKEDWDHLIRGYIAVDNLRVLKEEVLCNVHLPGLTPDTLKSLREEGCITDEQFQEAMASSRIQSSTVDSVSEINALLQLAREAINAGRLDDALRYAADISALQPDSALGWMFRSAALHNAGRFEDALAHVDQAMQLEPDNPNPLKVRVAVLLSMDQEHAAVETLERIANMDPKDVSSRELLGRTLMGLKRYEEALAVYDAFILLNPRDPGVWLSHGAALMYLRRPEEAIKSLDEAVAIAPDLIDAWGYRASIQMALGRFDEAMQSAQQVRTLLPGRDDDDWPVLVEVVEFCIWTVRDEWDKAKHAWIKAVTKGALNEPWLTTVSSILASLASSGEPEFVRQLIREAHVEEQFFPLARAIDYISSGDQSLVDKLSPEVRELVEDISKGLKRTR